MKNMTDNGNPIRKKGGTPYRRRREKLLKENALGFGQTWRFLFRVLNTSINGTIINRGGVFMEIPNNVFVDEKGQMIIVDVRKMSDAWLDSLILSDRFCRRLEEKYETTKIEELILKADHKELHRYLDCKHDLMVWGYE
jgi:hypothetical protein